MFIPIFLAYPMLAIAQQIFVHGPVENVLIPKNKIKNLLVFIEFNNTTLKADYNKNNQHSYERRLPMEHINKQMSVKSYHESYSQVKPIQFTPTKAGPYENILFLKHRDNLAEEKITEGERFRQEGSLTSAIKLVNQAMELSPQARIYIMKVQIIGQMLQTEVPVPLDLLKFGEAVKLDENFQKFSPEFRHNFYLQLGSALAHSKHLEKKVDVTTTYYDLTVGAFDEAMALQSVDARAYQGKYITQLKAGFYSDMISTIKEYFMQNPNVTNEKTVKYFLADWVTGVEKLTGYPKETEEKYIESLQHEPQYRTEWNDLFTTLSKYEKFYREGDTPLDQRLKKTKLQGDKFSGVKP